MLNQIVAVTLRLLTFRAGPQDFPYTPQLVAPMPALTVAAYFLFWSLAAASSRRVMWPSSSRR
jgi:hypothetical protein